MKLFNLKTLSALVAGMSMMIANANAEVSLRFGYEAPRTDTQHLAAKKFNELLNEKTKGEIKLKLFPDSTLGNAQTMISGVRGGTIDLEMSGSPNFTGLEPKLNVIDIPFIFKDRAHVYKVLDGEIGQGLLKDLEAQGLKGLAFWDVGFRAFSNSKHPVTKPEDIKGLKVRTNQNPMYIEAFKLLGANPVPMPLAELYTALETRAVDAQEHPIGIFWSSKLYEVQKYLAMTNHILNDQLYLVSNITMEELPENLQKVVKESAEVAAEYHTKLFMDEEKSLKNFFKSKGVTITEPNLADFKKAMKPFYDEYTKKNGKVGEDAIKAIEAVR